MKVREVDGVCRRQHQLPLNYLISSSPASLMCFLPCSRSEAGRGRACFLLHHPALCPAAQPAGCSGTGWSLVQTGGDWRGNCAVNCSKFILEVTFLPLSPMSHLSAVFFSVAGFSWGAFSPFLTPYPSPSGIGISLGGSPCSHGAWFDPTDPTSFP